MPCLYQMLLWSHRRLSSLFANDDTQDAQKTQWGEELVSLITKGKKEA